MPARVPMARPADALILDHASNGRTGRLFATALTLDAQLQAAEAALTAWGQQPLLTRLRGLAAHHRATVALAALRLDHRKSLDAFNLLVDKTRTSSIYRIAQQASQQSNPQATPPASPVLPVPAVASPPDSPSGTRGAPPIVPAASPIDRSTPAPTPAAPALPTVLPVATTKVPLPIPLAAPPARAAVTTPPSSAIPPLSPVPPAQPSAPGAAPSSIARLTIRPAGSGIDALFTPRSRTGIPTAPPDSSAPNRIYLPIAVPDFEPARHLGAQSGPRGGVFLTPDQDLDLFEAWLPFYAHARIEPLNVDLIPASNWGGSLANMLTPTSWKALRAPVIQGTNDTCALCGMNGHGKSVDCHEIWEYHRPLDGSVGVQKLVRILPVCKACHEMFHLGKASIDGRLGLALERLAWINRWSEEEVHTYHQYVGRKWEERSERAWMLDLSVLGTTANLILKGGQAGVTIDEDEDLHYQNFQGPGATRFMGVRFTGSDGTVHGPLEAPDYRQYNKDV